MSDAVAAVSDGLRLRDEVEDLLFREAALLDAREFAAWLELFTEDCLYWIPSNTDDLDPSQHVSIVYDQHQQLRERVWRLDSGLAYAQEPQSRTAHLIGNVRVLGVDGDTIDVESVFVVTEFRRHKQEVHSGRYRHRLRRHGDGLRIAVKKVILINNDGHLGNLSVLL